MIDKIKEGSMKFMLKLSSQLYTPGDNFVVSPFSLISAMSMLLPGTGGSSRYQLLNTLFDCDTVNSEHEFQAFWNILIGMHRSLLVKNQNELNNANMLYSQQGFVAFPSLIHNPFSFIFFYRFALEEDYVATLNNDINAVAKVLDFLGDKDTAIKTINEDANNATKGLIPEVLDDIDVSTKLILMNVIYFKGEWAKKFPEFKSEYRDFTKTNGQVIKVYTMCNDSLYPCVRAPDFWALMLDYSSYHTSMVIILPNEGITVAQVLANLDQKSFLAILSKMTEFKRVYVHLPKFNFSINSMIKPDDISVALPKFKLSSQHKLKKALRNLGITDVFENADLSRVSKTGLLNVSDVIQKAVIEIDEEGTVASASTMLINSLHSAEMSIDFIVDRPFLFFLISDEHEVLFNGVVEDPTK